MVFIIVAVAAGLVIGLIRGGSIKNVATASFALWPVLLAGIVVQIAAELVPARYAYATLIASYVLLFAFCIANFRFVGMGIVAVGLLMNFAVIAINHGMPVSGDAIVTSGAVSREELPGLKFGAKRHLQRSDDKLTVLSDIIPVPLVGEVLSFGDLVMSVGVADVIAHLVGRRNRRRGGPVVIEDA